MNRRLVVTDVTDMGIDIACVAGIDAATREVLRLESPRPKRRLLQDYGGLIPGSIIEVDWTPHHSPAAPHVEDGYWNPGTLVKRGQMEEEELTEFLSVDAFNSVSEAFGEPAKHGTGGNVAFQPREGPRSLATVRTITVQFTVWPDKVRVDFQDGSGRMWTAAPLQDLAVKWHRGHCETCATVFEARLRREFEGSGGMVRVGLAREWNGGCWLQVNAVCLGRRQHFLPTT